MKNRIGGIIDIKKAAFKNAGCHTKPSDDYSCVLITIFIFL